MLRVKDGVAEKNNDEDTCPQCESIDVVGSQFDVSNGTATQECACNMCSCQWLLEFKLSAIVVNTDGNKLYD